LPLQHLAFEPKKEEKLSAKKTTRFDGIQ